MGKYGVRILLVTALFVCLGQGAFASCVNGGWYCGKLYFFDAGTFKLLDGQMKSGNSPWGRWSQSTSGTVNILNNNDTYIDAPASRAAEEVTDILKPLRQAAWRGEFNVVYQSEAAFASDVADGKIDVAAINAVTYSPEYKTGDTPATEQQDPVHYAMLFAGLAHKNGLNVVLEPSCAGVGLANCASQLLAPMGLYGDEVVMQAQAEEGDPVLYGQLVKDASALVKKANPYVKFVAQLSTGDGMISAGAHMREVAASGKAVFDIVDGFMFDTDTMAGAGSPSGVDQEASENAFRLLQQIQD